MAFDSPFDDKHCPQCGRQLTMLKIDSRPDLLMTAYFACEGCMKLYATENIVKEDPGLYPTVFTGGKRDKDETEAFYESIELCCGQLIDFINVQLANRKLLNLAVHFASVSRLVLDRIRLHAQTKRRALRGNLP